MKDFEGRLSLQKIIYLMQEFGISLGYSFNWYIHGPYSPELASDGFKLDNLKIEKHLKMKFMDEKLEEDFEMFLDFIKRYKKSPRKLELLASIAFLYKNKVPREKIIEKIKQKPSKFDGAEIKEAFKFLRAAGVLDVKK